MRRNYLSPTASFMLNCNSKFFTDPANPDKSVAHRDQTTLESFVDSFDIGSKRHHQRETRKLSRICKSFSEIVNQPCFYQLEMDKPIMKLVGKEKAFSDPFKFAEFTKQQKELSSVRTTGQYYNQLLREKESWQNALRVGTVSSDLKQALHHSQETETSVLPYLVHGDDTVTEAFRHSFEQQKSRRKLLAKVIYDQSVDKAYR